MASSFRKRPVSSIRRAYSRDPNDRIDSISGVNADHTHWTLSQAAAITAVEVERDEFFVTLADQIVKLVVVTRGGEKYLQSEREKTHPDDLVNLTFAPQRKL